MLLPVAYLLDRLRHPRSRADELRILRSRMARARLEARAATPRERELAVELRGLRLKVALALGEVTRCRECARKYPLPHGRWDGGYCCGTNTDKVFTDDEIASLVLAGTTAAALAPPRSDHAGCVFRGPTGCSLDPGDRPSICSRYLCLELVRELRARGDAGPIDRQCRELSDRFAEFVRERAGREERDRHDELERVFGGKT